MLLGTATGGPPGLVRGTELIGARALTSLGEYGSVAATTVAPDDTAVLLGLAAPGSDNPAPAVVRVAPDGTERQAVVPGTEEPVRVDDVAITPDGGVLVAFTLAAGPGSQLLRFDSGLAPVGEPVELPRLEEFGGFLAVGPDGTAYLCTTRSAVELVRVPVGASAPETVATIEEGPGGVAGLVVDPTGTWAYLTGVTGIELGQTVTGVELASGEIASETVLCAQGTLGEPVLDTPGTAMVVPGTCNDLATLQAHVYLLSAP